MTNAKIVILKVILSYLVLSLLLISCVYDPYYASPPSRHIDFYPYDYYYYPSARVYFHFTTGYYYYVDNNRWIKSKKLLPQIHLNPRDRVRLRIDSERPFLKHSEHIKKYKPIPEHRVDIKGNVREREENRKLYQEYKNTKDIGKRKHDSDVKDDRRR